jgi:hypothetical protein
MDQVRQHEGYERALNTFGEILFYLLGLNYSSFSFYISIDASTHRQSCASPFFLM